MRSRAALTAGVLALGALSGALLGGCGGGTKTVTVAAAPSATAEMTGTSTSPGTTSAARPAAPSTTATGAQGTAGQGASSTTRTAPAPAFVQQSTTGAAEATGTETAAAVAVVKTHGYTPNDASEYHPNQTLRVLVGTRTGSADGYDQRAFFFLDGRYIGTDASQPSATVRVVSQSDTEVVLAYPLYRPHDPLCCPGGGRRAVHFQLNDGKLVPLQPIPPASSATEPNRQ
jgi:LppP/LprE lipoprotein